MPELLIKYKNKRAKEALIDFSKYFDFSIVQKEVKKKVSVKKEDTVLEQIEKGLKEVKLMQEGKIKFKTLEEFLSEE